MKLGNVKLSIMEIKQLIMIEQRNVLNIQKRIYKAIKKLVGISSAREKISRVPYSCYFNVKWGGAV